MNGPAEISYLQLSAIAKKQVLWLNVTVNDLLLVAIHQCIRYLLHVLERWEGQINICRNSGWSNAIANYQNSRRFENCFNISKVDNSILIKNLCHVSYCGSALVIKSSTSLELLVHFTSGRVFQNQKHPLPVMEIIVEAQDVWVPEKKR